MADARVVDFNSDLVSFWGGDFDIFNSEVLARFPCYGGLWDMSIYGGITLQEEARLRTLQVIV